MTIMLVGDGLGMEFAISQGMRNEIISGSTRFRSLAGSRNKEALRMKQACFSMLVYGVFLVGCAGTQTPLAASFVPAAGE